MICCYGNIVAYLLLWCSAHFITFTTIISIIMWVAREYFKKDLIAPKLVPVRSKWQHLSKFEWTSLQVKNKSLMRGKRKRRSSHQEKSVCRSCYLAVAPISSFSSTAYWPWPPCNVWCLHCHNSSWLSVEYVSIACWCVLRWGKVSESGREVVGGWREVKDREGVRCRKYPDSSLICSTITPSELLLERL